MDIDNKGTLDASLFVKRPQLMDSIHCAPNIG